MIAQRLAQAMAWRLERLGEMLERFRKALIVINYHRLYTRVLDTPFDEKVFGDMTLEYFQRQLRWLRANTQVLSQEDLRGCLRRPRTFPRRGVLLTFDDGYRDNFDLAFPALKDQKLPALFFIPTKPLQERCLGWWDVAAYLVKRTNRSTVELEGTTYPLDGEVDRQHLVSVLQERFKTAPEALTKHLLEELAARLETRFPPAAEQDAELMTVDQLREMTRAGMAMGAHTHTHRVLSTLSPEEQRQELIQGKGLLEQWLGEPVFSLAYPVGRRDSFGEETKRLAREAGYEMAFSFYSGFNQPGRMDPLDLRRSFKRKPFEAFTASILYPRRDLPLQ